MTDHKCFFAYNDIEDVQYCNHEKVDDSYESDYWEGSDEDQEELKK